MFIKKYGLQINLAFSWDVRTAFSSKSIGYPPCWCVPWTPVWVSIWANWTKLPWIDGWNKSGSRLPVSVKSLKATFRHFSPKVTEVVSGIFVCLLQFRAKIFSVSNAESQHDSLDRFLWIKKLLTNKKLIYFALLSPHTSNKTNKQIKPNLHKNLPILGIILSSPFFNK